MKEMRVKGELMDHKEVSAAIGVKVVAPGLESAVAGTQMFVVSAGRPIIGPAASTLLRQCWGSAGLGGGGRAGAFEGWLVGPAASALLRQCWGSAGVGWAVAGVQVLLRAGSSARLLAPCSGSAWLGGDGRAGARGVC